MRPRVLYESEGRYLNENEMKIIGRTESSMVTSMSGVLLRTECRCLV